MTVAVPTEPTESADPPALEESWLTGSLTPFRDDPLRFLCETATRGDLVRFRIGPFPCFFLRDPDHVQHILVDNNHNYDKQTWGYDKLRMFLGNGLLTSEGDFWLRQRRIAQPAFHRKRIAGFADTMVSMTNDMLDGWDSQEHLDMAGAMTELTLYIAAKTLLDADVRSSAPEVGKAVTTLNVLANEAMWSLWQPPLFVPTPNNLKFRHAARTLDKVVLDIIEERRRTGADPGDLLSMLMQARDEDTGEQMSDAQLRDEVMTMFIAGHETTANALAWTFYLLSTHPLVARKLDEELDRVLGGRTPELSDLPELRYTEMVIKESMRLYPPVWGAERRVVEDDVIGGYHVPAKSLVIFSPYVTHRLPRYWPNPEGFDPERFTAEGERSRPRYAYFPFSGGPRMCIGNAFAMMEAQIVVAMVWQRFRPWLVPGHPIVPEPLVTLRPKHGVRMQLERRAS